ncbi:PREDICTED: protein lin-9 homolog [Branchiostoma belcheri]|uniref:Protein lin-9 homolog n=1 Tax=Branchiostoma belcheri TaxID=7741 RepID=A0A6P5AHI3_BRABE|nr:PREDICTED: protein lin-9 homolog [Branchiostoma belcheri]KAI8499733.1 Protein lin-9 [Branchiostoma belcheri]
MADDPLEIDLDASAEALVSLKAGGGKVNSNGTPATPPRRGNPPRVRKRNRLIFNDDEDTTLSPIRSPRKVSKTSHNTRNSSQASMSVPDKKAAQRIGSRLKNLLKLPKAHKWCIYEWFYSNLDKALFEGDNDFCVCLRESFPQLKTRKLSRVEWSKIRRLMGKPRRCSSSFFAEERSALEAKRQKIRLLQQRKVTDISNFKDLPDEIPLPLVIGTKVTARLRGPHDGLFTGQIEAVDTANTSYRVTFDRPGLGTHTIPDTEVLSNEQQETMPLTAFAQKQRPRQQFLTPPRFSLSNSLQSPAFAHDPMLGQSPLRSRLHGIEGGTLGGFPVKFLVMVTRLSKVLLIKKDRIKDLREMNTQAEKTKSHGESVDVEFQKKYATLVLELERLNRELNTYLIGVQQYCQEIAPEQGLETIKEPAGSALKKRCEDDAMEILQRANEGNGAKTVQSQDACQLITKLTSLMLQIKALAENELNSYEFKSLSDALEDIRQRVDCANLSCFQNNVEIHVAHVQSGLSQMGNLHAFAQNTNNDL